MKLMQIEGDWGEEYIRLATCSSPVLEMLMW